MTTIKNIYKIRNWKWLVFLVGLIPRIILAIINRSSNDDHFTPILLWIKEGVKPMAFDCWECYQPPLFYWIQYHLASTFSLDDVGEILNSIHWFNFLLSSLLLLGIIQITARTNLPRFIQISIALFWALSPEIISIGSLGTNDMMVILFGFFATSLALYGSYRIRNLIALTLLIVLAGITKGNGIPLLILIPFYLFQQFSIRLTLLKSLVVGGIAMLSIYQLGGYASHYNNYGTPFISNQTKVNPVSFNRIDTTYKGRRGVMSITSFLMSFPVSSLIKHPQNTNYNEYPLHRTKLWTQLVGQFSYYQFEQHPWEWRSMNNDLKNIGRFLIILHLPLFYLLVWNYLKILFSGITRVKSPLTISTLLLTVYLTFLILYSIRYRDFGNIKLIFILPCLPAIMAIFQDSIQQLTKFRNQRIVIWLSICSMGYVLSFIYLAASLT